MLKMDLATNELAIYLWENYIECNDSTKVIFMGVGEAYKAILHILNTRNCKFNARLKLRPSFTKSPYSPPLPFIDEALEQIAGIVGFIGDNPIRPVTETFITDFGKWYYRVSPHSRPSHLLDSNRYPSLTLPILLPSLIDLSIRSSHQRSARYPIFHS